MNYPATISIIIYYFVFLLYYRSLFPREGSRYPQMALSLVFVTGGCVILDYAGLYWLNIPLLMLFMACGIWFAVKMSFLQALYAGGLGVLTIYSFRGIITSIWAWISQESSPSFALFSKYPYAMTMAAGLLSLAFFQILRRTLLPDKNIRFFLKNKEKVKSIVIYDWAAVPFFALMNLGGLFEPHVMWYLGITLAGSLFTLVMLIYSIYQAIRSVRLTIYKENTQLLEKQLTIQLRHYNFHHASTEAFRSFRHDSISLMRTLKTLIGTEKYEEALAMLDEACQTTQHLSQAYREYSDNATLNAVLQDLALLCKENSIRYSFMASVPRHTELTPLDSFRIFSNITANAVEACQKVPEKKRFIKISTRSERGWVLLDVVNSFNGDMCIENNWFESTKQNKEEHGLGLQIVEELVESKGGIILCDVDTGRKIFRTKVLVPQCQLHGETP
ncbi:sensor histidine kinase [Lacrimispora brassicae]